MLFDIISQIPANIIIMLFLVCSIVVGGVACFSDYFPSESYEFVEVFQLPEYMENWPTWDELEAFNPVVDMEHAYSSNAMHTALVSYWNGLEQAKWWLTTSDWDLPDQPVVQYLAL